MEHFKLYNGCRIVKGYYQSMIYDLERMDNSNLIPNSLYEILSEHGEKSISEIKAHYNHEYDLIIDEYFDFLFSHEYAFCCEKSDLKRFPTVPLTYKSPKPITNAIIDYEGSTSISLLSRFIIQLSDLKCEAVEFRAFEKVKLNWLENEFLLLFNETSITSLQLMLPFDVEFNKEAKDKLFKMFPRVKKITFYSAPEDSISENIEYIKKHINPEKDCGSIHPKFFSIGFETFSEAQSCNSCLHQKISLDRKGYIKGCPSMDVLLGTVPENSLKEVLDTGIIKETWFVTKDDIDICSDCEYRYCCTDCRVFVDDKNKKNSRPTKCQYNPYIGRWKWKILT